MWLGFTVLAVSCQEWVSADQNLLFGIVDHLLGDPARNGSLRRLPAWAQWFAPLTIPLVAWNLKASAKFS